MIQGQQNRGTTVPRYAIKMDLAHRTGPLLPSEQLVYGNQTESDELFTNSAPHALHERRRKLKEEPSGKEESTQQKQATTKGFVVLQILHQLAQHMAANQEHSPVNH